MADVNQTLYTAPLRRSLERRVDRVVAGKRREMLALLDAATAGERAALRTALDIGSTRDNDMASSNYLARELARRYAVTLLSDQPIDPATDIDFEVAATILGDASNIDPAIGKFDLVVSNATIEHVGDVANQAAMIASCIRMARRYVVITTPNRWHPLEFHTRLPLLHWLPKGLHRWILRRLGLTFFAREEHLNLLDRRVLETMLAGCEAAAEIESWRIETVRLFGLVSNLVLIVTVSPAA